ncbi:Ig-like domain-containing protein [Frondihabitans australicus]|uniref:SDR-like Ig domain-containing protein n=1 Tax=Frondihabitans australicus TaxID=386892 RepID=A0A495IIE5_9MICO|nr:Ig-like domain-containing protein [Frondihabitans australicus]RKR75539.1 hypothetical protein C8E83_2687 [Frondihabitans australicus]
MSIALPSRARRTSSPEAPSHRRAPRVLAALAVAALAIAGATLGLSAPASAAMISGAITDVSITPTSPAEGGQVTTNIDWKVPDGTQEGDTFTLTLSSYLKNLPLGFALRDPATGAIVANATLSSTSPAVITFTMTAYASQHFETHGTAFVTSNFNAQAVPAGVPTTFTSTTGDGQTFSTVVTPTGGTPAGTASPTKYGSFARADQGRTDPTDFLIFHVTTPEGPFDSATIRDAVPAGQTWTYDCSTIQFQNGTLNAQGQFVSATAATPTAQSCTTTSLTASFGAQVAGHVYRVRIAASLAAATGDTTPAQTFRNTANVSWVTAGTPHAQSVQSATTQATGGGTGVGTNPVAAVAITKGDSLGNAADTEATAATLPADGEATLEYVVTNTGTDALTNVQVADQVLANGTVTGLTCDFTALGGPASGTSFSGHFPVGATFDCTASLSGVAAAAGDHHDIGTVTATGVTSASNVTASNDYWAVVTAQPAGGAPTGPGNGTTGPGAPGTPGGTGTGGNGGGTTGAGGAPAGGPVAPAATDVTPVNTASSLAYTGTDVVGPLGVAGSLLGLGLVLSVVAGVRRRRRA